MPTPQEFDCFLTDNLNVEQLRESQFGVAIELPAQQQAQEARSPGVRVTPLSSECGASRG